jgi:hypothetical protein
LTYYFRSFTVPLTTLTSEEKGMVVRADQSWTVALGRRVVKDEVDTVARAPVGNLMEHQIIELEPEMCPRRHVLVADNELDVRIGDERYMNAVRDGERRMHILMAGNTPARPETRYHSAKSCAARRIVSVDHLIHDGHRLRREPVPANTARHSSLWPFLAKQQNDRLSLRVDVVVLLTARITMPRALVERQNPLHQSVAVYFT